MIRTLTFILILSGPLLAQVLLEPGKLPAVGALYHYRFRYPDQYIRNPDGTSSLAQNFPKANDVDWGSADWHRTQVDAMIEAGLTFVLPVYRPQPEKKGQDHGANVGLEAFVSATRSIRQAGGPAPRIGMYLEPRYLVPPGSVGLDLRSPEGLGALIDAVKNFYQRVPRDELFGIGRPGSARALLFVGPAAGLAHDLSVFDRVIAWSRKTLELDLFVVLEKSWGSAAAHARFSVGAPLYGPTGDAIVACLGPGQDDSRVQGSGSPIRRREDTRFYKWSWDRVLPWHPQLVLIDSWNDFQTGSGIAPSAEYTDSYITLTRRYVQRLERGMVSDPRNPVRLAHPNPLPRPDRGWWKPEGEPIEVRFDPSVHSSNHGDGVRLVPVEDGRFERRDGAAKRPSVSLHPTSAAPTYLYLGVADEFAHRVLAALEIEVMISSKAKATLGLQYDSWQLDAMMKGAYKSAPNADLPGGPEWSTVVFKVPDARLSNRQNSGADLRLVASGDVEILRVTIRRVAADLIKEASTTVK